MLNMSSKSEYWKKDGIVEDVVEEFILHIDEEDYMYTDDDDDDDDDNYDDDNDEINK